MGDYNRIAQAESGMVAGSLSAYCLGGCWRLCEHKPLINILDAHFLAMELQFHAHRMPTSLLELDIFTVYSRPLYRVFFHPNILISSFKSNIHLKCFTAYLHFESIYGCAFQTDGHESIWTQPVEWQWFSEPSWTWTSPISVPSQRLSFSALRRQRWFSQLLIPEHITML